jgi:hypothetical protein
MDALQHGFILGNTWYASLRANDRCPHSMLAYAHISSTTTSASISTVSSTFQMVSAARSRGSMPAKGWKWSNTQLINDSHVADWQTVHQLYGPRGSSSIIAVQYRVGWIAVKMSKTLSKKFKNFQNFPIFFDFFSISGLFPLDSTHSGAAMLQGALKQN